METLIGLVDGRDMVEVAVDGRAAILLLERCDRLAKGRLLPGAHVVPMDEDPPRVATLRSRVELLEEPLEVPRGDAEAMAALVSRLAAEGAEPAGSRMRVLLAAANLGRLPLAAALAALAPDARLDLSTHAMVDLSRIPGALPLVLERAGLPDTWTVKAAAMCTLAGGREDAAGLLAKVSASQPAGSRIPELAAAMLHGDDASAVSAAHIALSQTLSQRR